ncbi:hypothetical protein SAMN04515618_109168 [Collimonas sp. OK307]|uniref:hypothetical protein n=1 Tax=Collimonas sp. OK307 TaxID=1801620 RepID=UPI0008EE95C2|nr:hypothetical protein [Collimonas sp. OK307]SFI08142.1 hypothetical protein SAMN04515618_109168 [Collimonas sp. OK307]
MPWLPIYCNECDQLEVLSYLNKNEEIAFIVSAGAGRWVAVKRIEVLEPSRYCLWHIPGGSLPLFRGAKEASGEISNPFDGWVEVKSGADTSLPYFGAHPGVIWLNIRNMQTDKLSEMRTIGLSSFEWIGNHYRVIGIGATMQTEKFWKILRQWVKKQTSQVPRGGPRQPTPPEIWAFRGAFNMFENGAQGENNPF